MLTRLVIPFTIYTQITNYDVVYLKLTLRQLSQFPKINNGTSKQGHTMQLKKKQKQKQGRGALYVLI